MTDENETILHERASSVSRILRRLFKNLVLTAVGVGMVILALMMPASAGSQGAGGAILAMLVLVGAGLVLVYLFLPELPFDLRSILSRRPVFALTTEGIEDHTSREAAGFLRWEEIEKVRLFYANRILFVALFPKDSKGLLGRLAGRPLRKTMKYLASDRRSHPFAFAPATVCDSVESFMRMLEEQLAKHGIEVERT